MAGSTGGGPEPRARGVTYADAPRGYFERRGLRRYARVSSLWALGVGAVISGDFFGWNFGLAQGGFGGMLFALVLVTAMYAGLCFSIAEMSPALPHTGGAYSFARSAMGPFGAYVTGLAENMEYVLTPAVIVTGIGGYLGAIAGTPPEAAPLWWLATYAVFVGLNVLGVEVTFRFTVAITLLALAILGVFYVGAIPHVDVARYAIGEAGFLPAGAAGVFRCLPFAMWFYLAIEELPLAAEESYDPRRDMPRGLLFGFLTLVFCAFATLFLSSSIAPGAAALGRTEEPLFAGLTTIFGAGIGAKLLALVAVTGLVASFHTILFAFGRQIYSLSRAGYFPRVLSLTHPTRKTPHVALVTGALLGYGAALLVHFTGGAGHPVGAVLLNMTVFGAVLSYVLQMLSFVLLRVRRPDIERPYRSPLGVPGAVLALVLACVVLVSLFAGDPIYRKVVIGAAAWYAAGLLYFALFARHRLVFAPEEAFAEGRASAPRDVREEPAPQGEEDAAVDREREAERR